MGGQLFASWGLRWITLWRRVHACVCVLVHICGVHVCVCHICVVRVCVCVCTLSLSAGSIIVHSAQPFCLRSNEISVSSRCTGQFDTLKFRRILHFPINYRWVFRQVAVLSSLYSTHAYHNR